MSMLIGLQCHLCGKQYPAEALWVCQECLGPLEAVYDYARVRTTLTRESIESRPRNLWRYRELLPIAGEPRTGLNSGFTPLVRAERLGSRLGVRELYIKDDSVNHPTLSYKDRVVSVAATRALELGFKVFGCASTGNLANSVSAHAARLGLECFVFIPHDLETGKILGSAVFRPHVIGVRGNYDDANRLCTQIADRLGWGFANINLRTYYAEGAKTMGFEIAEQLGWRFPQHIVSPVAGGTLLPRIARGLRELKEIGLVQGELPKIHAAQAAGCAPVVRALRDGLEYPEPVIPDTIAKSIAIGNPADGFQVVRTVTETGGSGAASTDEEILSAMEILAETEGIFTEPAGGATLAGAMSLIRDGRIPRDESIVVVITGNGYKTAAETLGDRVAKPVVIGRSLAEFEAYLQESGIQTAPAAVPVTASVAASVTAPLTIHPSALQDIAEHAERSYPNECCGALVGRLTGADRLVETAWRLTNVARNPQSQFAVDPSEYRAVERQADGSGASLIGFYHSHPQGAAVPSETDLAAAWPSLSYVIVADREMTSWRLRDDRSGFEKEEIVPWQPAS